jgi:putative oxidoreductase
MKEAMMFRKLTATSDDPVMTILRLVLGVVFLFDWSQKVVGGVGGDGFSGTMNFFTHNMGIPAVFAFLAIAAEFLGSLGLILGLLARVAASGIIVNMVMAILMVHRANGIFMNWAGNQKGEGYEYHLLAIAIGLAVVIRGAGAFSVDRLIGQGGQSSS